MWLILFILPLFHPQFRKNVTFYRHLDEKLVRVDTYCSVTKTWLLCRNSLAIWWASLHSTGPNQRRQMGEAWMVWSVPMEPILQAHYHSKQSYFRKMCMQPICHMLPLTPWCTTFLIMPARCWWGEGARTQENWVKGRMRRTGFAWFQHPLGGIKFPLKEKKKSLFAREVLLVQE